jgi:hypothetical protein
MVYTLYRLYRYTKNLGGLFLFIMIGLYYNTNSHSYSLNKIFLVNLMDTFIYNYFFVYIGDNSLNSFENLQYLQLENGSFNVIEKEKAYFETKSQSLAILVRISIW